MLVFLSHACSKKWFHLVACMRANISPNQPPLVGVVVAQSPNGCSCRARPSARQIHLLCTAPLARRAAGSVYSRINIFPLAGAKRLRQGQENCLRPSTNGSTLGRAKIHTAPWDHAPRIAAKTTCHKCVYCLIHTNSPVDPTDTFLSVFMESSPSQRLYNL